MEKEKSIIEYANTSKYYGGGWTPEITGYDADDNEYRFEVDLHESARYNWNKFKEKFPGAKYPNKFYHELWYVREDTQKESRRVK
jgi:hypothetical protein